MSKTYSTEVDVKELQRNLEEYQSPSVKEEDEKYTLRTKIDETEKNFNVPDTVKREIDKIFAESKSNNCKYGRGDSNIIETVRKTLINISNYVDSIFNEEDKIAAQFYAGFIKVDMCTFIIRALVVAKNIGLAQSSVNSVLKRCGAFALKEDDAKNVIAKTFMRSYPCLIRKWSVRQTKQPFFETKKKENTIDFEAAFSSFYTEMTTIPQMYEPVTDIDPEFNRFMLPYDSESVFHDI